jgi:YD repeat-containing protein
MVGDMRTALRSCLRWLNGTWRADRPIHDRGRPLSALAIPIALLVFATGSYAASAPTGSQETETTPVETEVPEEDERPGEGETPPKEVEGEQPDEPVSIVRELPALRSETSDTFLRSDGTYLAKVARGPLNYRDSSGAWQPIDTHLSRQPDGSAQDSATELPVTLPASLSAPVTAGADGFTVSFSLQGAAGNASIADSTASYAQALPNVDATYEEQATRLKETLSLQSAAAPTVYRYHLSTTGGLSAKLIAGAIVFSDAGGTPRYVMPAPSAADAGAQGIPDAHDVHYVLSDDGSELDVVVDSDWLHSSERVFPVTVDPTTEYWGDNVDCFIASEPSYENSSLCGWYFYLGYHPEGSAHSIGRALLRFELGSSIPEDATVVSANLNMTDSYTATSAQTIEVDGLEKTPTNSATWNKYDGTNSWTHKGGDFETSSPSKLVVSPTGPGHVFSWGIAPLVQRWVEEPASNHGLIVKAENEAAGSGESSWVSDSGEAHPYIEVIYSPGILLPAFDSSWGEPGSGSGQFKGAGLDTVDGKGNLWVADRENNRVEEFNSSGKYLRSVAVSEPQGVATNKTANDLYVVTGCHSGNCVEEFSSSTGKFIRSFAPYGTESGHLYCPNGAAVDSEGNVWVVDANGLKEYSGTGSFVAAYGSHGSGAGQVSEPAGLATDHEDHLFVADYGNKRVDEFSHSGGYMREIGAEETGPGALWHPYGVAVDPRTDTLHVVDQGPNRLVLYSITGSFLGQFKPQGSCITSEGVAIDSYGGEYVSDDGADRVDKWDLPEPGTGQPGWYTLEDEADGEGARASVNVASGNLLVKSEDLAEESETHDVRLDRYYNSQALASVGGLGARWGWDAGPDVYLINEGSTVVLRGPSGYSVTLKKGSKGTYSGPEEFEGSLVENKDETFTLTNDDNLTYQFSPQGTMTAATNESGAPFTVTDKITSGQELLQGIAASSGEPFSVTYNSTPEVTKTLDPASRERKYAYSSSKELVTYTDNGGGKVKYAYNAHGYLNKITMPDGTVETVTTVAGKVSEVRLTSAEGETTGENFSYQPPASPTCKPKTDAVETTVTQVPSGETTTYCFNAAGAFTGQKDPEEAELEGTEEPELTEETCTETAEFKEDCALEEAPPEPTEDLPTADYGLADSNWLQEQGVGHPFYPYLSDPNITALKATKFRRTVPWNMVSEAEHNEEKPGENVDAQAELQDVEEWIKLVKARGAEPYVSFDDACPAPAPEWDDPREGLTKKEEEEDDHPCSQLPTPEQYRAAVVRFVKPKSTHAILAQVKNFTAMNEPNFAGYNTAHERYKPTWNWETGAERSGQYWRVLNDLCVPLGCVVAAGEFADKEMSDAFSKRSSAGYKYFSRYWSGMGRPTTAHRWAWHSYADGEEVQTSKYLQRHRRQRWRRFHNFVKRLDWEEEHHHGKYKEPNVWLTEQGTLFIEGGKPTKSEAWQKKGHAENIMNGYVKSGRIQLSNQPQVTRFFYYASRGEPYFDSGLLEAAKPYSSLKPPFKYKPNQPREIYRIFKQKTAP